MCALDALSVAPVFDEVVGIESSCHVSGERVLIQMQGDMLTETAASAGVLIGIRWQQPVAVAARSLCMEMVFLRDRAAAEAWRQAVSSDVSLYSLPEAVAFASQYFRPLLE